jgi:uncharacterized protein YdaU (DUF1376 family)
MAQFPSLMLWTDAWIADTRHLTRSERGTYLDLLILMWRTPGCRVPNDNDWLAKRLKMSEAEIVAELRPIIVEFCQTDGNWIFQKRLQKEFRYRLAQSGQQSARIKKRWRKSVPAKPLETNNAAPRSGNTAPVLPPTLPLPLKDTSSFFLTAAKNSENKSPADLATALPTGALARPAHRRANGKGPSDESLEEIVKRKGWT